MIEMPFIEETTRRTMFPRITRELSSATLFIGCMKAIEETGVSGWVCMGEGVMREIHGAKVTIKAKEGA